MKKKQLFKSKTHMIIYFIVFSICIFLFILIGKIDFQKNIDTQAKKFSALYDMVGEDNLFVFSNANDVLEIINGKSGVILMGFPSNKWMNNYAYLLNEVGKEVGLKQIYYYDFLSDREENNGTYETIVNKLKVYVPTNDLGKQDIQSPTVVIVNNGEVVGYFDDVSIIKGTTTPDVYFNESQNNIIKENIKAALMINYLDGE